MDPDRGVAADADPSAVLGLARGVESMPVGFYCLDTSWRFTYINALAEQLVGRGREQLLGQVLWEVFSTTRSDRIERVYRAAAASGRPASMEAYHSTRLDAWFDVQVVPSPGGLAVYFLDITERHRAGERAKLLARVTQELSSTLDAQEAVARLARLVVPALADWCVVSLVDAEHHSRPHRSSHRGLRDVGVWHVDPAQRATAEAYAHTRLDAMLDTSFLAQVLSTGRSAASDHSATELIQAVLAPGTARDLVGQLAPESFLVLPLLGRGHTVGLLTLLNGASRSPITDDEVTAATDIAGRAGLALDNARLYATQRNMATELQRSLITALPQPVHLQLAARYAPAASGVEVGGDWYDAFTTRDGSTALVIGDVAGHDRAAAVAMAQVRNLLRGIAYALRDPPAAVLGVLDESLRDLAAPTLTSAVLATIDPVPGTEPLQHLLRWSNAGHPPPLLLLADGTAQFLDLAPDQLLGVDPDTDRTDHTHVLPSGATLLLYTDGLVERRGEHLETGLERLRTTAGTLPALDLEALCDALLAELAPGAEDDVALLAVRARPV